MNKVNEIKMGLSQIESNFEKETAHATSNGLSEEVAMYTLQKKQQNLAELEKKAKNVAKRIPQIQDIEVALGLPDDVVDQELATVKMQMDKSLT